MDTQQQLKPGSAVRRALKQQSDQDDERRGLWQQRLSDYVSARPAAEPPRESASSGPQTK